MPVFRKQLVEIAQASEFAAHPAILAYVARLELHPLHVEASEDEIEEYDRLDDLLGDDYPAIQKAMTQCTLMPIIPEMTRVVFKVDSPMVEFIGSCYLRNSPKCGDRFHFDYGSGIETNNHAQVVWVDPV